MDPSRAAHIGEDGRWIAIPVRVVPASLNKRQAFFMFTLLAIGFAMLLVSSIRLASGKSATWLMFGGFALITPVVLIAAFVFVLDLYHSFRAWAWPRYQTTALPIRATPGAVRVPLAEPFVPHLGGFEPRNQTQTHDPLYEVLSTPSDPFVVESTDVSAARNDPAADELTVARAYAAFLRRSGCKPDSLLLPDTEIFAELEALLGRATPRLWVIDDAPLIQSSQSSVRPARRRWFIRSGESFWRSRPYGVLWLAGCGLASVLYVQRTYTQSLGWLGDLIAFLLAILVVSAIVVHAVYWVRSQSIAYRDRQGGVWFKSMLGKSSPRLLDPDSCRAVVYRRSRDDDSNKPSMAYGEVHWRFLLSEAPHHIDVPNFDPRGTPWWDYVLELETAPIESRVCCVPASKESTTEESTPRQVEST